MNTAPAHSSTGRLRRRADFLALRGGRRVRGELFSLQAGRAAGRDSRDAPRFGYTVTRRVGGAVVRNRVRRRLKEAVRLVGAAHARPGHDYVLIGARAVLTAPFDRICSQLAAMMEHAARTGGNRDATAKEDRVHG